MDKDAGGVAASRRAFLAGCGASAALILAGEAHAATQAPVVKTRDGRVRGATQEGVHLFRGIPYGGPTGGAGRFQPPTPVKSWTGIRDALSYGASAPQLAPPGGQPMADQSEDCLVLNVWTPGLNDGRKRPVMFWAHGGGLSVGSGADRFTEGLRLAKRHDVVIVTINHRLNLFGYLYFGDLMPAGATTPNVGQLDLVAGLRWVRDNIAQFGGDPNNVTIFGHSGGGTKVAALLAMPTAKGLFHKAIQQSGFGTYSVSPKEGRQVAEQLLSALNIPKGDLAALQAVPVDRMLAALQVITHGHPMAGPGLTPDGTILPQTPFAPEAPNISPDIPMLVGHAETETTVLFPVEGAFTLDWAGLDKALKGTVRDPAGFIAAMRQLRPQASASDIYFAITTEIGMGRNARIVAEKRAAAAKAPVHAYLVSWRTPQRNGELRSPHGVEVPMVFDNVGAFKGELGARTADAQRLADIMSRMWTNFARTGDPNGAGLPPWPDYKLPGRATMIFDDRCVAKDDPLGREQALVAQYG